jgi:TIR domain
VFSPDALKSKWCGWEIDMAITMNREGGRPHIIPVIAEKCNVPSRLRHLLHVNFVRRYDVALNELLTNGFGISKVGMVQVRLTLSRDRRLAELDIRARKPRFDAQSDSSMPFVVEKFPNHCKKCQSNFSGF